MILSYDIPMSGDRWQDAGGYSLWTRTTGPGDLPLQLWKMSEAGAAPFSAGDYALHNVRGGLPHRLAHGFGFWRISDGDTIFLKTTEGERTNYTFVVTIGAPHYQRDAIAWFCPACHAELTRAAFETRRYGVPKLWEWALEQVRGFNADPQRRTCSACGTVHPLAYGLDVHNDDAAESEARATW